MNDSINRGQGPYVFKISGQIYHRIGSLSLAENNDPRFLQLYIFDTQNEVQNRLNHFDSGGRVLRPEIVQGLVHMLDELTNTMSWFEYLGLHGNRNRIDKTVLETQFSHLGTHMYLFHTHKYLAK